MCLIGKVFVPIVKLTELKKLGEGSFEFEVAITNADMSFSKSIVNIVKVSATTENEFEWYFEDYLDEETSEGALIARTVEDRFRVVGQQLFEQVFADEASAEVWRAVSKDIHQVRFEIVTGAETATWPWELLFDPVRQGEIALETKSFVRKFAGRGETAHNRIPQAGIRMLLVIARPEAGEDVAYRSVASQIMKGISIDGSKNIEVEVLRPATFSNLSQLLARNSSQGKFFDIIHFDGHGQFISNQNTVVTFAGGKGRRGFFFFENEAQTSLGELIDGFTLGRLLVENKVEAAIFNACRSAYCKSDVATPEDGANRGSFAQELVKAGINSVVAFRYSTEERTVCTFFYHFYQCIARGYSVSEAVTYARKQLFASPLRIDHRDSDQLKFVDWPLPIVFESSNVYLCNRNDLEFIESGSTPKFDVLNAYRSRWYPLLPLIDTEFIGRDEEILAIDRYFDSNSVCLIHGLAGSGKTACAIEFAKWYVDTAGLRGPLIFTSFEFHRPWATIIEDVGSALLPELGLPNTSWYQMNSTQQESQLMDYFKKNKALWIWDNIENITESVEDAGTVWSIAERDSLRKFLKYSADLEVLVLLTSRSDEDEWLGEIPCRIPVKPLKERERWKLAKAVAKRHNCVPLSKAFWLPLLQYSQGNPLTLNIVVRQAARNGLQSPEEIECFVNELKELETPVEESRAHLGRSRSLSASLNYGFKTSFTEAEKPAVGLLHLFRSAVGLASLSATAELASLGFELSGNAEKTLLDKAADIGLLVERSRLYFEIHPALPWFLEEQFNRFIEPLDEDAIERAERGYVKALAAECSFLSSITSSFWHNENNLLNARNLCIENGWWKELVHIATSLSRLYQHGAVRSTWIAMLDEMAEYYIDADSRTAVAGREFGWREMHRLQAETAFFSNDWDKAETILERVVNWDRRELIRFLPGSGNERQRAQELLLIQSLSKLGQIQANKGHSGCFSCFEECFNIARRHGDIESAAEAALGMSSGYRNVSSYRDEKRSKKWAQRVIDLLDDNKSYAQNLELAQAWLILGSISRSKYLKAREAKLAEKVTLKHWKNAFYCYRRGLESALTDDAFLIRISAGLELGELMVYQRQFGIAIEFYLEAIRESRKCNNLLLLGRAKKGAALALFAQDKDDEAIAFLDSARLDLQECGAEGVDCIKEIDEMSLVIKNWDSTASKDRLI